MLSQLLLRKTKLDQDNADQPTVAVKFDQGKARYDLVPIRAFHEIALVAEFGVRKYSERNWENGFSYGRLFAAAMRHLTAFFMGEDYASDSGLHHLAHAAWNCMAIVEFHYRKTPNVDNRPIPTPLDGSWGIMEPVSKDFKTQLQVAQIIEERDNPHHKD